MYTPLSIINLEIFQLLLLSWATKYSQNWDLFSGFEVMMPAHMHFTGGWL